MSTDYPPEPWQLRGELLVSAFLIPADELPAGSVLPGRRPLRWGRRVLVGAAFVRYEGGVLEYDELLVAVPSRGRGGLRVTIPLIWVDSPASRAGGRELWGIPKELAEFTRTVEGSEVEAAMGEVAALHARYGRALLPRSQRIPLPTLQRLDGRTIDSRNLTIGRLTRLRTAWTFTGPLAFLAGRRPVLGVAIRDARIIFGMDVDRDQ